MIAQKKNKRTHLNTHQLISYVSSNVVKKKAFCTECIYKVFFLLHNSYQSFSCDSLNVVAGKMNAYSECIHKVSIYYASSGVGCGTVLP